MRETLWQNIITRMLRKNSPLRDEHDDYTYFANKSNVKSLLPLFLEIGQYLEQQHLQV